MEDTVTTPEYQRLLVILIEQRTRVGLTQADVARALKKPQSFVSKYEHGERRLDIIETIALCKILELPPQQLLLELTKGKTSSDV